MFPPQLRLQLGINGTCSDTYASDTRSWRGTPTVMSAAIPHSRRYEELEAHRYQRADCLPDSPPHREESEKVLLASGNEFEEHGTVADLVNAVLDLYIASTKPGEHSHRQIPTSSEAK